MTRSLRHEGSKRMVGDDGFVTDTPLGGEYARLRFAGTLDGKQVIWTATLYTLAHLRKRHPEAPPARNFFDVGPEGPGGRELHIGLDVPVIDRATVLKAIIMIRQYRRLAPGRQEFGDPRA